jgi:subtilisin family serine protease
VGDNGDGGIGMRQSRSSRIALAGGAALIVLVVGSWLPAGATSEDTEAVIVVLDKDAPSATAASVAAEEVTDTVQGEVLHVYSHALHGFAAEVPTDELDALAQHPSVAAVIPDLPVRASVIDPAELTTGIDRIEADRNESDSPVNVDIAIIDSGISFPHADLNVINAVDCLGYVVCDPEGDVQDANGHGTHVAGIAAARIDGAGITGVAPGARLWSVRVLDANGEGFLTDVIAGIDFVTANSASIEVANMSLGFAIDPADLPVIDILNQVITESVAEGVVFAVAAGNDSIPASQAWPAVNPDVIAVSAIADGDGRPGGLTSPTCAFELDDTLADFSNFGPAVDMAAPGVCIVSTWPGGTYATSSGTSMASPFVAGAAARYIAESGVNPSDAAGAAQVRAAIVGAGVTGACGFTDEFDGVEEPLLFVNGPLFGGDGTCDGVTQPPPPPPSPPPPPPSVLGDGVGVVDQGSGLWTLRRPDGSTFSFIFGNPGDIPFLGDWDCDGIDTPGLYRQSDGFVYLRNSNTQGIADIRFFFGNPGDLPLAGDFNGDGCDTVSIYRASEARWYVINALGANDGGLGPADFSYLFGDQGDVPFVGDWNNDGIDTPGLRRFSNGFVYIRNTNSQGIADQSWFYGDNGDHVFTGDFNGDGTDSIGLFRPANTTIYLRNALSTGIADTQFHLGTPNSKPVAGKFN